MRRISLAALGVLLTTLAGFSQEVTDSSTYKNRKLKLEEVNFVSGYYGQDGNNSAVTGGIGSEHLTDFATTIDVKISRYDYRHRKHSLSVEAGVDVYTSASSDKIDPNTISSASSQDVRVYPSITYAVTNEFFELLPQLKTADDLAFFNKMNDEFVLKENPYLIVGDSIRTENIYNVNAGKDQPWRVLRTGVMLLNRSYVLQINESMVDTADLVWAIVAIQAGLFSLLLAGLVLINRKLSRIIWDPFHTILDKLKKYQIDKDTSIEIPRSSTAEFSELSVVVSQLVRKNHEAFQSQKEFTENASHELQTPLAICRTKLELLAQTAELTEEQADLVESLFDAMERISRLIKNLLLLSKLDNREFFEREHVQIETIVKKCVESFSRPAAEKNLTIKTSVDPGASVEINPGLLDVLISNLISNAVRHTPEGCVIAVDATKDSIEVSNDGLPFEYPEKIFDRFRRESRTSAGNGLGLSIVKKVCDVTGNDVNYSYSSSRHHFKILFNNIKVN